MSGRPKDYLRLRGPRRAPGRMARCTARAAGAFCAGAPPAVPETPLTAPDRVAAAGRWTGSVGPVAGGGVDVGAGEAPAGAGAPIPAAPRGVARGVGSRAPTGAAPGGPAGGGGR